MLESIKKKTINIFRFLQIFFKDYLPHIVFMVFVFQLLIYMGTLPYLNIIGKYYYYVFASLWLLANFLFKKYITNKKIFIAGMIMFLVAIPFTLLEMDAVSDSLGFAAFIFIFTFIIRQIIIERDLLR